MTASSAESLGVNGSAAPSQLFVINLAASTSPMALSHPSSPELKRYTFFVSRQREEGRERFRLHMGYFSTQEEAETLLASVRDIYPAAWAGPAPTTGTGRRGRIAPGSVVAATPAPVVAAPAPAAVPAAAPAASTAASGTPPEKPAANAQSAAPAPAAKAAPVVATSASAAPATPAPAARATPATTAPATPVAAAPVAAAPARAAADAAPVRAVPVSPAPAAKPAAAAAAPVARPAATAGKASDAAPLDAMSNVRDVLAQLSESAPDAPTVQVRIPPALTAVTPPRAAPVANKAAPPPELSPADALTLLEMPPVPPRVPAAPASVPPLANPFEGLENEPEVRLVTPEDTQTLTDIKIDRQNNAPPCFAVQLVWSVSPIDVTALPHLAIFDAYTLYNVEGNRQGRKWYGLRLGFFSDPNSATQVANYVRSDYKAVAVVPVAVKERDRAKGGGAPVGNAAGEPRKASENDLVRDAMDGFELLADDRPAPAKRDLDDAARKAVPQAAAVARNVAPAARAATGAVPPAGLPKATGKPVGKRVVARRRPPPVPQGKTVSAGVGGAEVLESTLEILGASTLSLDEGGRGIITDAAARKPADKKASGGNRFSRLLSRLSGG